MAQPFYSVVIDGIKLSSSVKCALCICSCIFVLIWKIIGRQTATRIQEQKANTG